MLILKLFLAIILLVLLGSLSLIFTKRFRKTGLYILGAFILLLAGTIVWRFTPKHYARKYLERSSEWKDLNFRKYADSIGFYIGAIPGSTGISDPLFCENFNSVTPENALKMGPLLNNLKIGEYDFSKADKLIDEALEKNMRVRGHNLVWGKQSDIFKSPNLGKWLQNYPEQDRSKILWETIKNHITTVLNHFRGRIRTWDCVNEPMSMLRPGKLEKNVYLQYLGYDYIERSFVLADSIDPDIKLYLNENFYGYTGKQANGFIKLLSDLQKRNIPVSGVGIQSHIGSKQDTALTDLQNFIKRITDMGLEVEITELDVRLRMFDAADDPYEAQGKYYSRLLQTCMANPLCKGVTFWGFSDNRSWMDDMKIIPKPNEPYLFDAGLNPKPAFFEIYSALKKVFAEKIVTNQDKNEVQVIHRQEVYKTVDTFKLTVDIFGTNQSLGRENNTAIVFFHGGGWAYGTPGEFFTTCERYARMGIVTFSVDYRLSIENGVTPSKTISPIECVMDAKSAMRWIRQNAGRLHIDSNKIIASGQSAGGHLALCTAMIDEYNEKSDDLSISCRPDAILLFSACVNAVEGWCDRLLGDRRTRIWSISPAHNIKAGLPPMIEFHGIDDEQVPKWTVQFFASALKEEGNYFEQHMYEGRKHYLGDGNPKYSRYYDDEILKIADEFLRKFNLLK